MRKQVSFWAIIALCGCAAAAHGQLTRNEFIPAAGLWGSGANWELGHEPTSSEVAVIGAGQECTVVVTPSSPVGALEIAGHIVDNENVDRTVVKIDGASLTVLEDSIIDGTLHVEWDAKLLIGGDLTISGVGDIQIDWDEEQNGAEITYPDPENDTYVLTLEDDCSTQQSPCNQNNLDDECAIVLHGNGFVFVELNNNAIVSAEPCAVLTGADPPEGLQLVGREKYGCGIWRSNSGSTLNVRTEVRGGGKWILDGPWGGGCNTSIRIEACLLNLTGPVEVLNGEFLVEQTFCTSGHLTWVPGTGESSVIEVFEGAGAYFHSGACTSLFCPGS